MAGAEEERRRLAAMLPGAEIAFARGEFVALVRDLDLPIAVLVERPAYCGRMIFMTAGAMIFAVAATSVISIVSRKASKALTPSDQAAMNHTIPTVKATSTLT